MPTRLDILGSPLVISGQQQGPNGDGSLTADTGSPSTNKKIWILKSASAIYFDPNGPSASPKNRISGLFILSGSAGPVADDPFDFTNRNLQLGTFNETYIGGGGSAIGFSAAFVGESIIMPGWKLRAVWSQSDGSPSGDAQLIVTGVVLEHILC